MVVFVHSLGSIWHAREHASGATSVWNTTGIDDGKRIRPRSETYGQVALGGRAQLELHKHGSIRPGVWIASELVEYAGIRKLQLIVRAKADSAADLYLLTITEALIGPLPDDGWHPRETQIVSHSRWNHRQEIMLLLHPFGWLRGERATATLIPANRGCEWRIAQWSAK
ncbi:MAG TPA: hypothetical protein VIX14_05590 [Terriglobales bacterium]